MIEYLVLDTATTGHYIGNIAYNEDRQPFITQIAAIGYNKHKQKICEVSGSINPMGLWIDKRSGEDYISGGLNPVHVLSIIAQLINSSKNIISDNVEHDLKMIRRHCEAYSICIDMPLLKTRNIYSTNRLRNNPSLKTTHLRPVVSKKDHDPVADIENVAHSFFELLGSRYEASC